MTLYFAYGANMEQTAMRKRCPGASALGIARLRGWRYVIAQGYGSVRRASGGRVHGVLWRLTPRDLAALNSFESLDSGLYRRVMLSVEIGSKRARALVYVGRGGGKRRPMPGYQERLVAAAAFWRLPPRYIGELRRLAPGYGGGPPGRDRGTRMTILRRVVVRGRVQGVGYRAFVEDAALQASLEGWVRNRRDGTVEAVFSGPEDVVSRVTEACRRGPDGAAVTAVDVEEGGAEVLDRRRPGERFSVLPTV